MIDKIIREGETLISKLSEEEIMSLFDVQEDRKGIIDGDLSLEIKK